MGGQFRYVKEDNNAIYDKTTSFGTDPMRFRFKIKDEQKLQDESKNSFLINDMSFEQNKVNTYRKEKSIEVMKEERLNMSNLPVSSFSCDQCDYNATQKGNLARHINIVHNKMRNFECEECGHAFGQKNDLSMHVRAKHN